MARKKRALPRLAAGELEILQMLWRHGSVTLSEAQRAMERPLGYTTVQTRLNRLVDKGVVARSDERPARYRAILGPEETGARQMDLLAERVSGGSVVPLMVHLMKDRTLSPAEIAALKQLIASKERESRSSTGGENP